MARFEDHLDEAVDRMMAENTLPANEELRELLQPAQLLREAPVPAPRQRTARVRMNAALEAQRSRRGVFSWWRWPRAGQVVMAAVLAAMVLLGALANMALPGQRLYPLKQGAETAVGRWYSSPQAQASYHVRMANRRLAEIEQLLASNRPVPGAELDQMRQHWLAATSIPGVDPMVWQDSARDQARRLAAILPNLPDELQPEAQDILDMLIEFSGGIPVEPLPTTPPPLPMPPPAPNTPTPTPTATSTPTATPTPNPSPTPPTPTPNPSPSPTPTPTPLPTHHPEHTGTPSSTPHAGAHHPTATSTPASTITPTPTPKPGHDGDDKHGDDDSSHEDHKEDENK